VLPPLEHKSGDPDTALVREIKFVVTPTEKHYRWLLQALYRRRWFVLSMVGYLLIAIALLDLANAQSYWLIAFPVGLLFLFMPMLFTRLALRRIAASRLGFTAREVTISDRGVEVVLPLARVWYDLSLLKQVLTAPWGWVLIADGVSVIFVPRDLLGPEEIEELESLSASSRRTPRPTD
jgi:hypothetical protein